MQSLAVLSHKGGTGKTTVAVHLAAAADAAGRRTVLVDMDPQRSASAWSRLRQAPAPILNEARAGTFYFTRQAAERARTDLMVVDTAANCDADTLEAIRWADLCLIVTRPSFFDVRAMERTVEAVKALSRPAAFLVNQALGEQDDVAVEEMAVALGAYGLHVCATRIRSRVLFQASVARGEVAAETAASDPGAAEVDALWREVDFILGQHAAPALRAAAG